MKKYWFLPLSLCLLTACSSDDGGASSTGTASSSNSAASSETAASTEVDTSSNGDAGMFTYQNFGFNLAEDISPALTALGEPVDYFEAPSCAFDGLDKIFYYSSVELRTYPVDEVDHLSEILLKDDTVTTAEGSYIGMSVDDMLEKQGSHYTQDGNQYTFPHGDSHLIFIADSEGVVIAINYSTGVELAA